MIIDGTYFKGTTSIDGLNVDTGAPSITRTAMKVSLIRMKKSI